MLDIELDENHDIKVENLDMVLVDEAGQVRQQLEIKLRLWKGEWFLDTEFGTPYLPNILGKQLTLSGAIASIRKSIIEVEGVQKINSLTYTFNNASRNLIVTFTAQTPQGIVEVTA